MRFAAAESRACRSWDFPRARLAPQHRGGRRARCGATCCVVGMLPTGPHVAPCGETVMRILITDGNERAALAAARSLVRAGHDVCVAAPTRVSLAGASRAVRPLRLATDPLSDPAGYAAAVGRFVAGEGADLLLPITDPSLEAVLEYGGTQPAGVALPFADLTTYRAASDTDR